MVALKIKCKVDTKRGRLNQAVYYKQKRNGSQNTWKLDSKRTDLFCMKVWKLLDKYVPKNVKTRRTSNAYAGSWCVLEQRFLSTAFTVWEEYNQPISSVDEGREKLTLNSKDSLKLFSCPFQWNETEIFFWVGSRCYDLVPWKLPVIMPKYGFQKPENGSGYMCFSVKSWMILYNDVDEEDDESNLPIWREIFAERISIVWTVFPFEDGFIVIMRWWYVWDTPYWSFYSLEHGIETCANIVG